MTENARVLIVADSDEGTNYLAYDLLPQAGYEAIIAFDDNPPPQVDVVVADVNRVLISPLKPLKTQRELGCIAPALVIAPRLSETMVPQIFQLNVSDFISKPAEDNQILDKIASILQGGQPTYSQPGAQAPPAQQQVSPESAQDATVDTLQRRLQELDSLSQIGRMLTSVDDVDTVLSRIVDSATYLSQAEEGALFMSDEKGRLTLRAEKNMGQRQAQVISVMSEDSIATHVFQSGEPIIRSGNEQESLKVKTGYLVQALINVPIIIGQHIVGVLAVYNNSTQPFEQADLSVLSALSVFAAIGIDKARTITELAERIDIAAGASRKALFEIDTIHSPIEALDAQIETMLSGALGQLSTNQTDSLNRMRLSSIRLKEVAQFVQTISEEYQ